jgi:hypothetical protein
MKLFVRENARLIAAMLVVGVLASGLSGGSAGAVYLAGLACLAVVGWREKRRESG